MPLVPTTHDSDTCDLCHEADVIVCPDCEGHRLRQATECWYCPNVPPQRRTPAREPVEITTDVTAATPALAAPTEPVVGPSTPSPPLSPRALAVLRFIASFDDDWVKRSDILRALRGIRAPELDALLDELIDAKVIRSQYTAFRRGRPATFFWATPAGFTAAARAECGG